MLVFFLFFLLIFNKAILKLLHRITKIDIILSETIFWFIIKIYIVIIFFFYFDVICIVFKVCVFFFKQLILEFMYNSGPENIIIDPDRILQGIEQLDPFYKLYYIEFFKILYYIIKNIDKE